MLNNSAAAGSRVSLKYGAHVLVAGAEQRCEEAHLSALSNVTRANETRDHITRKHDSTWSWAVRVFATFPAIRLAGFVPLERQLVRPPAAESAVKGRKRMWGKEWWWGIRFYVELAVWGWVAWSVGNELFQHGIATLVITATVVVLVAMVRMVIGSR